MQQISPPVPVLNNPIAYIAIVNSNNEPVLFQNFLQQGQQELNMQLNVFCALDIIQGTIQRKFQSQIQASSSAIKNSATEAQPKSDPTTSYLGLLTNIYLADNEYSMYGYITVTRLKIVLIVKQKSFMENFDDSVLKNIFKQTYELYRADIFNPFNENIQDPLQPQISGRFTERLQKLVADYQEILRRSM